jgi:Fe2+ transport system protein FeoA
MNLWNINKNQQYYLAEIDDQLEKQKLRLQEIGFNVGESVEFVQDSIFGGPKTFLIASSVIALEKEVAEKIKVEPIKK